MTRNPLANFEVRGGIISAEFMENLREEKLKNPGVQFRTFRTFDGTEPKNAKQLDDQIREAFDSLVERWDSLDYLYAEMDVSRARERWILHVFKALGFDPLYNQKALTLDKKEKLKFFISHRGWSARTAAPLHTVPLVDLEQPYKVSGHKRSPHDELQRFLNASLAHKWGIVTNGIQLRVLRDFHHTSTKGYVEFDLQNILRERSFTDFRALYRTAHASRFLPGDDGEVILEQFFKESVAAGVKVGQNLRENVIKALEALGNGFIYFDDDLREKLQVNSQACKDYYSEVLRVIYRMLFLLYAEQRGMLPLEGLYIEEYSMVKLREQAEQHSGKDESTDLWEGLKATFKLIKEGCEALGVFGYNGSLFDDEELPTLNVRKIPNEDLLKAVRNLTLVEEEHTLKRINYLDLGVEEIGSIYESLLDFTPRVIKEEEIIGDSVTAPNSFILDSRGTERKTTGSYYTPPQLVDELIKSALIPVLEEKLEKGTDNLEAALLSMKVCDPACGSGAFLIAATNYLGKRLAQLRTELDEPSQDDTQRARRDVLQHCIYGVDLNPMAVELVKVSLWIETSVKDLPLNFLDHHIKCGNSLIGVTKESMSKPTSDTTFHLKSGDEKEYVKWVQQKNSEERKHRTLLEYNETESTELLESFNYINDLNENLFADVKKKKMLYNNIINSKSWAREKLQADCWCAAYYWPLTSNSPPPPTQAVLRSILSNKIDKLNRETLKHINKLAKKIKFFHWHLEFPDIISSGGFDVVLGNPPWERIKLQEKEWFANKIPSISKARTAAIRRKMIQRLERDNLNIYVEFINDKRNSESTSFFIRNSERYPLCGVGDINTFAVFSELNYTLINDYGRVGCIVPTGIATDNTTKEFFRNIVLNESLVSLFDFENKRKLFPDVAPPQKFCLLTLSGKLSKLQEKPKFVFFAHEVNDLSNPDRVFNLSSSEIELLSPNTFSCPIFRSRRDANIVISLYKNVPIQESPFGEIIELSGRQLGKM